jgi:hypothetical protein
VAEGSCGHDQIASTTQDLAAQWLHWPTHNAHSTSPVGGSRPYIHAGTVGWIHSTHSAAAAAQSLMHPATLTAHSAEHTPPMTELALSERMWVPTRLENLMHQQTCTNKVLRSMHGCNCAWKEQHLATGAQRRAWAR